MIDTVWPIEFGSRSPASCSSSKAMSMNKMIVGTENGWIYGYLRAYLEKDMPVVSVGPVEGKAR